MNRLLRLPLRHFFVFSFLFFSGKVFSQGNCSCPALTSCAPCSGGISTLILKYNGQGGYMIVTDFPYISPPQYISNGQIIPISGTRSDGRFNTSQISISVDLNSNASITVSCALDFDPNAAKGDFSIVSAISNGKPLCCNPSSDVTKPVIMGCPTDMTVSTTASSTGCSVPVDWTAPQVVECQLVSFESVPKKGSSFPVGTTTVVYTATDINNNTATCSFKVTVKDATPPVATSCPSDIIVIANPATCKGTATWTTPAFTDNCGIVSLSNSLSNGSLPAEFPLGTTVVTYSAKDNAGNVGTCKFNVIVKDNVAPVLTGAPANITLTADASCKAKASWVAPVFTDNCGLAQSPTNTHNPGDEFPVGKTTVTYTATDKSGNITTCAFDVTVKDLVPPTIKACPNDTTIKVSTAANINTPVSWTPPVVSDDCSSGVELTANYKPGDLFPVGATTVTYTAKDVSGNIVSCSFKVTVSLDQAELEIFQILTPDGNGVNDTWWIGNIEKFEKNKVVVVDRWGGIVYSATGYNNIKTAWNGENNSGTVVPTGTYFYTVTVHSGQKVMEKKGFIEVVR